MGLLIELLVLLCIFAIVWWAIGQLALPPPIRMVIVVATALVAILLLVQLLPLGASGLRLR